MSVAILLIYLSKFLLGQNQTKQKRKKKKTTATSPPLSPPPPHKKILNITLSDYLFYSFSQNIPSVNVCGDEFNVDHAIVCKRGGFIIQHHNELRDLEVEMLKMVCSHVEEEPVLQELTGVVIPTKPRMWDWIYTAAGSGRGKHLHRAYYQIRYIALRVLQTSKEFWVCLFRQSS